MKILVIGSGGREHALSWKIALSPRCSQLYCAPGNPGTATVATNVPIAASDLEGLVRFAEQEKIDLVVVGPDDALAAGIVDKLEARGIPAFGPTRAAARLESSKSFAKEFMLRHGIPTARAGLFDDTGKALGFLDQSTFPLVVKADGLALGKGVIIAANREEAETAIRDMLDRNQFGEAGKRVLLEEFLTGGEASIHAMIDGTHALAFPTAQDHKRAHDGETGPNTGGMGTFSPAPAAEGAVWKSIQRDVLDRFMAGIAEEKMLFRGLLFPGVMLTEQGPKVLEFNCRFGDPETQVLLPRLKSDLVDLLTASLDNSLHLQKPVWDERAAVCVILASGGYPGAYNKNLPITGAESFANCDDIHIFHAGTREENGTLLTAGGRVLGVTALANDLKTAREKAYEAVKQIHFEGVHYRSDIANKGISA